MKLSEVTLEQLCSAIEAHNIIRAGKGTPKGGLTLVAHDIVVGYSLFDENQDWESITTGNFSGYRYMKTQFGVILQAPPPVNEISIVQESMAKILGII